MNLINKLRYKKRKNEAVNGLLICQKKHKFGAINEYGKVVFDFDYDELDILNNFLIAKKQDKCSVIDLTLSKTILQDVGLRKIEYSNVYHIVKENKRIGLFNLSLGKFITGLEEARHLSNGNIAIKKESKIGVVSENLEIIVHCEYDKICSIGSNYIGYKDGKQFIITPKGISGFDKIERVRRFYPLKGFMSSCGPEYFIPRGEQGYDSEMIDEMFIVHKDAKKYLAKIEDNGEISILSDGYDFIDTNFYSWCTVVKNEYKYGYISINGNILTPCCYDNAEHFENGLETIKERASYRYTHRHVDNSEYTWQESIGKPLGRVTNNGKLGCVDTSGKEIIPCVFDSIDKFINGQAKATCCGIDVVITEEGAGCDIKKIIALSKNTKAIQQLEDAVNANRGC